jgi:hypothetical protein
MRDNNENQKKFNNIFNEKIKKTKNNQAQTKKIINEINECIDQNKHLMDKKVLCIMKDVPERKN